MNEKKPQHVNPGLDVTCDPTFHPDTYRSAKHLPRPEHCDHECVCRHFIRINSTKRNKDNGSCNVFNCYHDTRTKTSDALQQTASQMCDNILDELHDILKENTASKDKNLILAVADLHSRVLLWKERPDVKRGNP